MTPTRELTRDEFLACFGPPMRDVREISDAAGVAAAYAAHLDADGFALTGAVANIYRDAGARFDQVLLETETANMFLVVVVDLASGTAYGHRALDLNAEYGSDKAPRPR